MTNQELITSFYMAFSNGNAKGMTEHYHPDSTFEDPAFGKLSHADACSMWEMLLSNKDASPHVTYSNVTATDTIGQVNWRAEYFFGPKKRKVINEVTANFTFKDGKILTHKDDFSMWKWSRQAVGLSGLLLGWTPFFKKKVNNMTMGLLKEYKQSN